MYVHQQAHMHLHAQTIMMWGTEINDLPKELKKNYRQTFWAVSLIWKLGKDNKKTADQYPYSQIQKSSKSIEPNFNNELKEVHIIIK